MAGLIRGYKKHLTVPHPGWQRTDPLDRGLVGEWRFDPASGLILPDYSGYGSHGIVTAGTGWVSTEWGPAYDFGGAGSANVGSSSVLDVQDQSFEALVFINSEGGIGVIDSLFGTHAGAAGGYAWSIEGRGGGVFRVHFSYYDGAGWNGNSNYNQNTGVWFHCIGTWDVDVARFYIGGNYVGQRDSRNNPITSQVGCYIARTPQYGEADCVIAFVRLYNRALSAAEVLARYQKCLKRGQAMASVWMIPWGGVVGPPPVGQPMQLRGTTVPHLRQWHPRAA